MLQLTASPVLRYQEPLRRMSECACCSGSRGGQCARMWERMISGMSVNSRKTASANCASPAEALGSTAMGTLEDMVCCEVFSRSYKCYFSFRVPFLHEHLRKVVVYTGTPGPPVQNVRTTPCRARPTCLSGEPKFVRTQPTFHKFWAKVRSDSRSDLPPDFRGSWYLLLSAVRNGSDPQYLGCFYRKAPSPPSRIHLFLGHP